MTTSALSLNLLLSQVRGNGQLQTPFLDVLARHLGLEGESSRAEAALALFKLTQRVEADLEQLQIDDQTKKQLQKYLAPFKGLISMAHVHLDMKNAQNNFLKPDALVGLTNLHAAFSGKVERLSSLQDGDELSLTARELIEKIPELGFPDDVAVAVRRRLHQIQIALESFEYFGAEFLSDALEDLVGALVIRVDKDAEKRDPGFWSEVKGLAYRGFDALENAKRASNSMVTVQENVAKLVDTAQNLLGDGGGA